LRKLLIITNLLLISFVAIPNPPSEKDSIPNLTTNKDSITNLTAKKELMPNRQTKKDSIPYPIRKITLDNSYRTDTMPIDTSIIKLHIINPAYKNEHSSIFLTRLGYPVMYNNICTRVLNNDLFFPGNLFAPYIQDAKDNFFYDTRAQFSSLTYKNEGAQSNNEEYLQVLHTQNISKKTNIGLFYNLYSAYSKYNIQQATDHALDIFFRYSGNNYLTYNLFYLNSYTTQENGGITFDSAVNYKTGIYDGMEVSLKQASSNFKRIGFNSIHELRLNSIFERENDTSNLTNKDFGSIIYNFNLESSKRTYTDALDPTSKFYHNFYNGTDTANDSIVLNKITNKILLNSPNLSKYLPNLRFSLTDELYYTRIGIPKDSMLYKNNWLVNENPKNSYQSVSFTLDLSQKFRQIWWNFVWDSYFLGQFLGDQSLRLTANTFLNKTKTIECILKASQELKTPGFFYNNYFSNHFIWMNDFGKENIQTFSATALTKKPYFSLSAKYISIKNYTYFGYDSLPAQFNSTMFIYAFRFDNSIDLWKFYIENSIIYQTNHSDYIHVPKLIFYNSTSFNHTIHFFTGGKLYFRLGFDVYYQTEYWPDAYNPAVGAFYLQNKEKSGNYPQVDFHLTVKIKTVSFFFKFAHANANLSYAPNNAGYSGYSSFTAFHYPMLHNVFSLGINWLFYN